MTTGKTLDGQLKCGDSPCNVLFLIGRYYSHGGTERLTTFLANGLPGCHVVAAFFGKSDPARFGLSPEVSCVDLEGRNPVTAIRETLISRKIDAVVNMWCLPYRITRIVNKARRGLGVRIVSVLVGPPNRSKRVVVAEDAVKSASGIRKMAAWFWLRALDRFIRWNMRKTYYDSDLYITLSEGFSGPLQSYAGIADTAKIHAIGCPVEIAEGQPPVDIASKKRQILYVGRMDKENKRVNRIVETWETVCADYPDWSLVLVGGGPHLDELKAYVAGKSIPRVTFTGFVEGNPIHYYRDASIFMLTSDVEGFGIVLVEAMSFGVVPLVYGSYEAAHDIVDDGVNGIVTNTPYSHVDTVAALRRLIEKDAERVKMAAAAIEKARYFSPEVILAQWRNVLGMNS